MYRALIDEWRPNPDDLTPKVGEPPLHRAAREGDAEAVRRLVAEGIDPNGVYDMRLDPGGRNVFATPLMAAGSGDGATVETLRLLLDLRADPQKRDNGMRTALWVAGSAEVARLLIDLELSLEDVDQHGWTTLTDAVKDGLEAIDRARTSTRRTTGDISCS